QSLHYHLYALDFYLLALVIARRTGDGAADTFAEVASRMARFCRAMTDQTGRLPTIGDDDGGALFPICGRAPFDAAPSLCLAATLLNEPHLAIGPLAEEMLWMTAGIEPSGQVALAEPAPPPETILFPDTGYASLRAPHGHAIVDAGPHGFLNGGHAHADALSMTLAVDGRPLLIDPGTATYVMNPKMRDRFRSTAMHNTVEVGGRSQSVPAGPFQWATRTDARVLRWLPSSGFDYFEAEHTGYLPTVHRRTVVRIDDLWLIADHIFGGRAEPVALHWHLDPAWKVDERPGSRMYVAEAGGTRIVIACTAPSGEQFHGDGDGLGWCAPIYGQVMASPTLRFSHPATAPPSMETVVSMVPMVTMVTMIGPTNDTPATLEPLAVQPGTGDGSRCSAVKFTYLGDRYLAIFKVPEVDRPAGARAINRIVVESGELSTDAHAAVLRLTMDDEPMALDLISGSHAAWTGPAPFAFTGPVAADLHSDSTVLRQLGRGTQRW
ncbi:MAG: heparinase II/III-family protein, partial [Acidobacteria bacterium]|nr:heparinase II/III-family protein [Acidobacteriota bacterium]